MKPVGASDEVGHLDPSIPGGGRSAGETGHRSGASPRGHVHAAPAPPRPSPAAKRAAPRAPRFEHFGRGLRPPARGRRPAAARVPPSRRGGRPASSPGESGEPLGQLQRPLDVGPGGTTSVRGRSPAASPASTRRAGEDQVECAAEADDAGQPLGAAVDQRHPPASLGEAERGALGGDRRSHQRASSSRPPGRSRRSRRSSASVGVRRVKPIGPSRLSRRRRIVSVAFQVRARAEGHPAGTRQHQHARVRRPPRAQVGLAEAARWGRRRRCVVRAVDRQIAAAPSGGSPPRRPEGPSALAPTGSPPGSLTSPRLPAAAPLRADGVLHGRLAAVLAFPGCAGSCSSAR